MLGVILLVGLAVLVHHFPARAQLDFHAGEWDTDDAVTMITRGLDCTNAASLSQTVALRITHHKSSFVSLSSSCYAGINETATESVYDVKNIQLVTSLRNVPRGSGVIQSRKEVHYIQYLS